MKNKEKLYEQKFKYLNYHFVNSQKYFNIILNCDVLRLYLFENVIKNIF